jgi:CheY-like chemotaxis protein
MNMPNMDGLETVHELLRVNPQVKILAVSGSDAEERLAELVQNGAVRAFMRKPYTAQRLLRTLAEIREME